MKQITKSFISVASVGLASVLGLSACSDVIETEYANTDTTSNVTFYVTGVENSSPLDSVEIFLIDKGQEKAIYTDSNGVVSVNDLTLGDNYAFKIMKDGYATQTVYIDVDNASGNADYAIAGNQTSIITMYELGGTLAGQLMIEDDGTLVAAEGAVVRANISCGNCDIDYVETTVTAEGSYEFTDLPLELTVSIEALPFTFNDVAYSSENLGSRNINTKETIFMTSIGEYDSKLAQAIQPLSSDLKSIATNGNVVVTFNQPVDVDMIAWNDITIGQIALDISWNTAKTQVTIAPTQGTWSENTNYSVSFDISSVDGSDFNGTVDFNTTGDLASTFGDLNFALVNFPDAADFSPVVANAVTITPTDESITIGWAEVEGATSYRIYFQNDSEDALQYEGQTSDLEYRTFIAHGDTEIDEGPAYIQIWAINGDKVVKSEVIELKEN